MSSRLRVPLLIALLLFVIAGGAGFSMFAGHGVTERVDAAGATGNDLVVEVPRGEAQAADQGATRGDVRGAGDSREAQVLTLVNNERKTAGCAALTADTRLAVSARMHSADMIKRGFFDHTNPDGKSPGERIAAAGFSGGAWGENIAAGQRDAASVMKAWMNSPGHKANIVNCKFKFLGVGVADGASSKYGIYWTQNFGG
ncbi:CAP domain-containing protein [Longispora sp. NPDC051575]|uniref:CAP domain-containing protein n=1 Tax=Longispora sp. NPDC051575 TaxID=3154943 RepID=UPI003415B2E0